MTSGYLFFRSLSTLTCLVGLSEVGETECEHCLVFLFLMAEIIKILVSSKNSVNTGLRQKNKMNKNKINWNLKLRSDFIGSS